MKILIFGAGGMIGHKMFQLLKGRGHEVYGTLFRKPSDYEKFKLFAVNEIIDRIDVAETEKVLALLDEVKPDVVLNCVGITLRKPEIKNFDYAWKINSDFPQKLNAWVTKNKAYLVHFSTDCVFSGKDGPYTEDSPKSATDTYGKTKAAGEVTGPNALTLRGSMIGRELFGKTELLEWALSQKNGQVKGFSKAIYSGVTTNAMAELVHKLLMLPIKLTGIYQVSSKPISKLDLLKLINQAYHLNLEIVEDETFATSKILSSEKLHKAIGFNCPEWPKMVDELVKDFFKNNG